MLRLAVPLGALLVVGCSSGTSLRGPGESCLRSAECDPGLACVANRCGTDLGGLAEAGMVPPMMDAGGDASTDAAMMMMIDAGPAVDAGPMPDAGPPPMMDAGPPPMMDAGPPPMMDAG